MFFEVIRKKNVALHPRYFNKDLERMLLKVLMNEVVGNFDKRYGHVIAITELLDKQPGLIQSGTGLAVFAVTFSCVVMRPFKDEVLEAEVLNCSRMGMYLEVGALTVLVARPQIPSEFTFEEGEIRCWRRMSGEDKGDKEEGDEDEDDEDDEENETIQQGSKVRVKLIGVQIEASGMCALATIKGPFLGLMDD